MAELRVTEKKHFNKYALEKRKSSVEADEGGALSNPPSPGRNPTLEVLVDRSL